jgi:uncharacterized protein YdhG (YjbR/CyaY superfamily)
VAIRALVHEAAPEATEKISYGMPTFVLAGNLVHFAVFKDHTGFYPTPSGTAAFQAEIASYKSGKGSIQFPHGEELPMDLIRRIVEFRVAENRAKSGRSGARSSAKAREAQDGRGGGQGGRQD